LADCSKANHHPSLSKRIAAVDEKHTRAKVGVGGLILIPPHPRPMRMLRMTPTVDQFVRPVSNILRFYHKHRRIQRSIDEKLHYIKF
jgi:hypothetical protein